MKGIIYTRVSSDAQISNTSLDDQEARCYQYCKEKGIEVVKVFREEGASAKSADRKEFLNAINFCGKNKNDLQAFIVFKVDRFARNTEDHFAVRKILADYKITLHSVSEVIGNDPAHKFMETLLAASAEFDNQIRAQRCSAGMLARIRQGIYPWKPPAGYKCSHFKKMGEKKTRPDPPHEQLFPIIQRGLKEYAKGMYSSQTDLKIALDKWGLARIRGRKTNKSFVERILGKYLKFYAGIIYNPWDNEDVVGLHKPMISQKEYQNIVLIRTEKKKMFLRDRFNPNFPLRRTALCDTCKRPLTGSTSRGNGGRYHYYHCQNKHCSMFGKAIKKDIVEKEFIEYLSKITPKEKFLEIFKETVLDVWQEKGQLFETESEKYKKELLGLEERRKKVFDMLEAGSYTKEEFKERKAEIENQIAATKISMSECQIDKLDVEGALSFATNFISNLGRQWFDLSPTLRPRFQKLVLPEGVPYKRGKGFGTAKLGLIYEQIEKSGDKKSHLVDPRGIEPLIHLCHRCVLPLYHGPFSLLVYNIGQKVSSYSKKEAKARVWHCGLFGELGGYCSQMAAYTAFARQYPTKAHPTMRIKAFMNLSTPFILFIINPSLGSCRRLPRPDSLEKPSII